MTFATIDFHLNKVESLKKNFRKMLDFFYY